MAGLTAAEIELERLDNVIKAAEDWSKEYRKDPVSHAKIIKIETRLETSLRRYFREMSERSINFIDWLSYQVRLNQISASDDFTVDVLIYDDMIGHEDGLFIKTAYDPVAQAVALGAQAGETIYFKEVGISETSAVVQRTAKQLTAELVGKKIDDNGNITDNPRAKFRISDKTRADIRQSISTSLTLGEDQKTAAERLMRTLKNPKRAGVIARTEAVNGYQRGLLAMGKESGAVGKEWQSVNSADICGTNAKVGVIKIDADFPSGHKGPAAHPNCRCSIVLIYPEDPKAAQIMGSPQTDLNDTDLATIVRSGNNRPAAEINTKIEDLLNHGNDQVKVTQSIEQALKLPKDDAVAMLRAINYNGKSVVQDYYTVKFNPVTKKVETVLKDASLDPLKMTPAEIFKKAKKS